MVKEMVWSATRVNVANYCIMKYYLNYCDPDKPKPVRPVAYVKGSYFHDLIEKFWKRLGKPEEIKYNKKGQITSEKKYYDAQTFSNYAQRGWQRIIIADGEKRKEYEEALEENKEEAEKIKPHLINWNYENEEYIIKSTIPKIAIPLFAHFLNEGPPIFSELPINFGIGNKRFTGYIDNVRREIKEGEKKIIVRDYKTGKPWVGQMKKDFDPQLTMYNVGLSALCKFDPKVADKLGLEQKAMEKFLGNPNYINPDFKVEFFMIDALGIDKDNPKIKTFPEPIVQSERREEHFYEVLKMIEKTEKDIMLNNIAPERGRKCDDCDFKIVCAEKLNQVQKGQYADKKGQIYFNYAMPHFIEKSELPEIEQSKIKWKRRKKSIIT